MSLWILVCAVVLAGYLVASAIRSLSQALKPSSGSLALGLRASIDERFIVSQIATTLIAAQFGNPLYTEGMKSLHDERETICYDRIKTTLGESAAAPGAKTQLEAEHKNLDEILSNVDSAVFQSSVFFGGRTKFVQLAWDIYHDVCSTQREQTRTD